MKMVQRVMLALLLMLALIPAVRVEASSMLRVDALATTTTQLNLRAGPSAGTQALRTIPAGDNIVVRSGPHNGAWYGTTYAGASGYVHGNYLRQDQAARRVSTVTATADVTLRAGPGGDRQVVGTVRRGTQVIINSRPEKDGWRKVTTEALTGYALSNAFVRTLGNGGPKRIVVDISDQWLTAYEGTDIVLRVPVSTGRDDFDTPLGIYRVQWKAALRTMKGESNGEKWEVPDVPHAMYITDTGVALHGTYWHNLFGSGVRLSHGCVNLPLESAALLYDWASVGTVVEIQA